MELHESINTELIALVTALIGGFAVASKLLMDVLYTYLKGWKAIQEKKHSIKLRKMDMATLQLEKHPFWTKLYQYLQGELLIRKAPNEFKKIAAIDYITITWLLYEKKLKLLCKKNIEKYSTDELYIELFTLITNIREERSKTLFDEGMPRKVIKEFDNRRIKDNDKSLELYKQIIDSPVYENNKERIWAILDIQGFLLEVHNDIAWESISKSNGNLENLKYKGYVNTLTVTPNVSHT